MTKAKLWIIKYLYGRGYVSPTQIGHAYGDHLYGNNSFHTFHSAWASPKCLALVKDGLLDRNEKGHYALSHDGLTKILEVRV